MENQVLEQKEQKRVGVFGGIINKVNSVIAQGKEFSEFLKHEKNLKLVKDEPKNLALLSEPFLKDRFSKPLEISPKDMATYKENIDAILKVESVRTSPLNFSKEEQSKRVDKIVGSLKDPDPDFIKSLERYSKQGGILAATNLMENASNHIPVNQHQKFGELNGIQKVDITATSNVIMQAHAMREVVAAGNYKASLVELKKQINEEQSLNKQLQTSKERIVSLGGDLKINLGPEQNQNKDQNKGMKM